MIRRSIVLGLLGVQLLTPSPAAEPRPRVFVSVAISLRPAVEELATTFRETHSGVRVSLNAGGSGVLLQQILNGSPADLFISASPDELDRLEAQDRLAPGTRRTIASNRLVIVSASGIRPPQIPHDLLRPEFQLIAMGNPETAPVGRYARQALDKLGLMSGLRLRVVRAENSRQVLEYVARGEVEAGLVYATDAALADGRVVVGPDLPADSHEPILYQAAVLADAREPALATQLLDLLVSPAGRTLLQRYGFQPPP